MDGKIKQAKEWKLPSRSYGINASEAADILTTANEIKNNPSLVKAARGVLKEKLIAAKQAVENIKKD